MSKIGLKDGKRRPDVSSERAEEQRARRARLVQALRANLRKRKNQRHTPPEMREEDGDK
jgi:hypothetical protein